MNAVIVIKTANGFVLVPHDIGGIPLDMSQTRVATSIGNIYSDGPCVAGVLRELFEPLTTEPDAT
jgi:predicted HD phosphohydrolase